MLSDIGPHLGINAAAIMAVVALALRDQLKLRLVLLVSIAITCLTIASAERPMWDSLFWNIVTWLINAFMTVRIIYDRTHVGLSVEEEQLFSALGSLSPGEFRKLLRIATWHTAAEPRVLTREGVGTDRLFYILGGEIEITKGARVGSLAPQTFIGEIAFLRGTAASATVKVSAGTRYLEWPTSALSALLRRHQQLSIAVNRLLSADMAIKVSRAATG